MLTKQTTTIAALLAVTLGMAWMAVPTFVAGIPGPEPIARAPDPFGPRADATRSETPEPARADSGPEFTRLPPQDELGGPRRQTRVEPVLAPRELVEIFCDRASMTLIDAPLRSHLRCEVRRATHRNVIEHVLTDTAKIGFIAVEPSANERRLGVRDCVLGQFEPTVVVARNNPWQMLTKSELQAMLGGRQQTWPGSRNPVEVVGPTPGNLTNLFAEVLIPGDRLAATTTFSSGDDALESIRERVHALAVVTRPELERADQGGAFAFRELHVDGFRPSRTVYIVFRNEHDPDCARVLEFCRSDRGRAALGRVLILR